jgi:NAD(P)-dependent dehydrogenase (short-subunit alcohol dehydrogenase family)
MAEQLFPDSPANQAPRPPLDFRHGLHRVGVDLPTGGSSIVTLRWTTTDLNHPKDGTTNPVSGTMKPAVLILDATSPIGRALVQVALEAARPVIAVAADAPSLAMLDAAYPRADLTTLPGDFATDGQAIALASALRDLGRPLAGIVVAGACEPKRGRLLDTSAAALNDVLADELLPHQAAARALIPMLARNDRNGSYIVLGGPGSEHPWAGYGYRSIAAAATRMLVRVLHDEAHSLGVRVQMLVVEAPARTDDNREHACAHWPTALAIASRALALIDQAPSLQLPEPIVRFAVQTTAVPPDRRAIHARKPATARLALPPSHDAPGALLRSLLSSDNDKA